MILNAGTWPEGTYYMAVQAINPNGIGSAWSEEILFENHLISTEFTASANELSTADTLHVSPIYAREGGNYQYKLYPDGRVVNQTTNGTADIVFDSYGTKTVTLSLDGHTFSQGIQVLPFRREAANGYSGYSFDFNQDGWPEGFSIKLYSNTQGTFKELMKSFNTDLYINHGGYVVDFNQDGLPDILGNSMTVNNQKKRFLLNDGDMDFHTYEEDLCLNTPGNPIADNIGLTPIGDIDNNGLVDFVSLNTFYKNNGNGVLEESCCMKVRNISSPLPWLISTKTVIWIL